MSKQKILIRFLSCVVKFELNEFESFDHSFGMFSGTGWSFIKIHGEYIRFIIQCMQKVVYIRVLLVELAQVSFLFILFIHTEKQNNCILSTLNK